MELLTTSRLSSARACQRLHRIRYVLGYMAALAAGTLRFGTLVHKMLEAWWRMPKEMRLAAAFAVIPPDTDPFDRVRAEEMMRGYDARWALDAEGYEVLAVEAEFRTDLRNPLTGRASRTFELGGKIDVIVRDLRDGRILVVEHKTATGDIGPGSEYWRRLRMDGQVSVYFEGATSLGHDVGGCLYDVLGKPQQKPLQPGKTRKEPETPEEFRVRVREAIAEDPNRFYQRGIVVRLESEMEEALFDVWQTAQQIHEAEKASRAPRNPDACVRYNRTCEFFDVCTGVASLDDPLLFRKSERIHPELSEEGPREVAQQ
jgi:hypothetical protein